MNGQHLQTILWLRWRISRNQWRRTGLLNAVVTTAFVVFLLVASIVLFFGAMVGGSLIMLNTQPDPNALLFTWDVVVVVFLFVWAIALTTELQRSELLSLDRMLHLPVSLSGAFFLNYASSLLSLPIAIFLPGMFGLAIACIVAIGLPMLVILPLLLSFVFCVTAVTYQFRGWVATLMENKRHRKTIIVVITMSVVLLSQAPQLINIGFWRNNNQRTSEQSREYRDSVAELTRQMQAGEITPEENTRRMKELEVRQKQHRDEARAMALQSVVNYALLGNKVLPIGWFPYGVRAAALGNPIPGLLASMALCGVGALSLWRAYATTMRHYTGAAPAPKRVTRQATRKTPRRLSNSLEAKLPFLSEHVSAVALVGFRSLLRGPESKMALLTPMILVCVFGGIILMGPGRSLREQGIEWVSPFIAIGIIGVVLFGLAQLMINIFGTDRGGFRAYVLMPVPRHEVLLGKNLSIAPFAGCIALVLLVALHFILGMHVTHLLASLIQFVPSYLMFCLIGNTASIFAPMGIASGSLKPAQPNVWTVLVQMFCVMLAPLALLPAVAALSAETLLTRLTSVKGIPIYFVFSMLEAGLAIWLYRTLVKFQGQWLQTREPRMLELLSQVPE